MSLRSAYRRLVPAPVRNLLRPLVQRFAPAPDAVYTADYFRELDGWQRASYPVMADTIVREFAPSSVLDVGCGGGGLLQALRDRGVARLRGLDGSAAAIANCRRCGISVSYTDLSARVRLPRRYDLCVCLEVAEHLAPQCADGLVQGLSSGPSILLFSAAAPGQGGHEHHNEQPADYWVEKFAAAGMELDAAVTDAVRAEWLRGGVVTWYAHNTLIFRRGRECGGRV